MMRCSTLAALFLLLATSCDGQRPAQPYAWTCKNVFADQNLMRWQIRGGEDHVPCDLEVALLHKDDDARDATWNDVMTITLSGSDGDVLSELNLLRTLVYDDHKHAHGTGGTGFALGMTREGRKRYTNNARWWQPDDLYFPGFPKDSDLVKTPEVVTLVGPGDAKDVWWARSASGSKHLRLVIRTKGGQQ